MPAKWMQWATVASWLFLGIYLVVLWMRAKRLCAEDPERRAGYLSLARTIIVGFAVVAAVMAVLHVAGVPYQRSASRLAGSVFNQPAVPSGVVIRGVITLLMCGIVTWWLFFKGGIERLVEHWRLFGRDFSATDVKVIWAMLVLASTGSLVAQFFF